jgi:tetratricopeptide (TPR) repeat protein
LLCGAILPKGAGTRRAAVRVCKLRSVRGGCNLGMAALQLRGRAPRPDLMEISHHTSSRPAPASPFSRAGLRRLYEAAFEAALTARRAGTFAELVRRRPRVTRHLMRRFDSALCGSAGNALDRRGAAQGVGELLLNWAVAQLRPDRGALDAPIAREAWLHKTGWRPALAVMAYGGFLPIPDFPEHYRRRANEAPVDNLCGLWGVGASTFYRYLERAKQSIADMLVEAPGSAVHLLSLRRLVASWVAAEQRFDEAAMRRWHAAQIEPARQRSDAASALWHALQAGDAAAFVATLGAEAASLARAAETDALIARLDERGLDARRAFDLQLARASLHRSRDAPEREHQAYEAALRIAVQADDRLLLGIVYGAMGKFHEPRDADRAFACYEESAEFLRDGDLGGERLEHYRVTLVRLAWLYVLRNDPRSKTVLDQVESLGSRAPAPPEIVGILEQTWGEYWRRAGDLQKAIAHKHRALAQFERLGDIHSVLKTYANLSLIYGEAQEFERALDYGERVLSLGGRLEIGPEMRVSTRLNLGATHFWLGQLDQAIEHYRIALDESLRAELKLHVNRAHFNLAEAYYKRFQQSHDPQDERLGDSHAAASMHARPSESSSSLIEATRGLKNEILGAQATQATDRLLPEESAVHFEEMSDIARQRAVLAVPVAVEAHIRARLEIANTYLAIAVKEREAALELARRHGQEGRFAPELAHLRTTFERRRSREEQLAQVWIDRAGDVLPSERRAALLSALLRDSSVNKSTYAVLCAVSPATASKHLTTLAERGLLRQTGKGPSTRYLLAD